MKKYEKLYLSYFNDFLTVEYFAVYHDIHEKAAVRILNKGRVLYNDKFGNT